MLGLIIVQHDFGNALFADLPKVDLQRLQRVKNMEAKIVLGRIKYDSVTQCLKTRQWLSIRLRIEYKILVMVYTNAFTTKHLDTLSTCFN